jgi:hypothetical protein
MKKLKLFVSFVTTLSFILLPIAPAFALGEVDLGTTSAPPTVSVEGGTPAIPTVSGTVSTPTPTSNPIPTETNTSTTTTVGSTTISTETSFSTNSGDLTNNTSINISDTTPPVIAGVISASLLPTEATVAWVTDELAISHFRYGPTTDYGETVTLNVGSALLIHAATMLFLTPGTIYYYCIDATDLFGNTAESCGHQFTTATEVLQADTNPPTISSVTITSINTTSATITWTMDELANGYVEYGLSEDYGLTTETNTDYAPTDSKTLSNLLPNTEYHYRITSQDEIGNIASTPDETFMTEALAQPLPGSLPSTETTITTPSETVTIGGTVPPIMVSLLISGVETSSLGETSATVAWMTDLPSDSQVEYGDSINLGGETVINSALTTNHSVSISGLTPDTNYIFRVKSKPLGASAPIVSDLHEFSTLITPIFVTTPAVITSVSSNGVTTTSANVSWTTDVSTTGNIEYGLTTGYGEVATSPMDKTSHTVSLPDLESGAIYHFRAKVVNPAGDITYTGDHTFTTSAPATPVVISAPSVDINLETTSNTGSSETSVPESTTSLPIEHPTFINGTGLNHQIVFIWDNTNEVDFFHTIIVRKEGSYPISPTDGNTVYENSGKTFTDTDVTNGTTYYYAFYSYDHGRNYSTPVHVSLAPIAQVSQITGSLSASGGFSGGLPTTSAGGAQAVSVLPEQFTLHETPVIMPKEAAEHFTSIWKKGDQNIEIEHIQHVLRTDGEFYPSQKIDGKFGSITENGLKKFQAKYNLPKSGTTDEATQKQLNLSSQSLIVLDIPEDVSVFETNLKRGDKTETVRWLQQMLRDEGSYMALVDGQFGGQTESAVQAFQSKYFIKPISGIVGPKTRHMLQILTGL